MHDIYYASTLYWPNIQGEPSALTYYFLVLLSPINTEKRIR